MTFYAVLLFDEDSTRQIGAIAADVAQLAGYDPAALLFPPHVTLAAFEAEQVADLLQRLEVMAAGFTPLPIAFGSIGWFLTDEDIVYLAPTITRALASIHRATFELVESTGGRVDEHHRPGAWSPHCTLAVACDPSVLPLVVVRCRGEPFPIRAHGDRLELVELREGRIERLLTLPLAGTSTLIPGEAPPRSAAHGTMDA